MAAVPGVVVLGRVRGGGIVIAIETVLAYSGTALDPGEEMLEMAVVLLLQLTMIDDMVT